MLKKVFKMILLLFALIPVLIMDLILLIISPFFICPIVDDIALGSYKREVLNTLELPPNTEVVETVSGCGNTGGAGNHTEMYVAILVKTTLSENEWESYDIISHDVSADGEETFSMNLVGVYFRHIDDTEGYYILERIREAPFSEFDLRGH